MDNDLFNCFRGRGLWSKYIRNVLNTNCNSDMVSTIVGDHWFFAYSFAVHIDVTETVGCWQNPMPVYKTTTTRIRFVLINLRENALIIVSFALLNISITCTSNATNENKKPIARNLINPFSFINLQNLRMPRWVTR